MAELNEETFWTDGSTASLKSNPTFSTLRSAKILCRESPGLSRFPPDIDPLNKDPFDDLIKIDVITAQRGFSDPKTEDESHSGFASLSTQLRRYFSKHLNPSEAPDASDIEALEAIEAAKTVFNEKLVTSFKPAIGELEGLNYPGIQ